MFFFMSIKAGLRSNLYSTANDGRRTASLCAHCGNTQLLVQKFERFEDSVFVPNSSIFRIRRQLKVQN